jgi:general secretion pathway protein G
MPTPLEQGDRKKMINRLREKRDEQGFTLIELLIVVIVLAILAAIVVFALGSTRSDSVKAACSTSEKSVELSAEAVNTKTGSYPATGTAGLVVPATGALLKAYPTSTDYQLNYVQDSATQYHIDVLNLRATGNPVVGQGQAGCQALP